MVAKRKQPHDSFGRPPGPQPSLQAACRINLSANKQASLKLALGTRNWRSPLLAKCVRKSRLAPKYYAIWQLLYCLILQLRNDPVESPSNGMAVTLFTSSITA